MTNTAYSAAFSGYVQDLVTAARQMSPEQLVAMADGLPFGEAHDKFLAEFHGALTKDLGRHGLQGVKDIGIPNAANLFDVDNPDMVKLFTVDNPYAAKFASQHSAELVGQVTQSTRQAVRSVITGSFQEHRTVGETARLLRGFRSKDGVNHKGIIGLHQRDADAVVNNFHRLVADGHTPEAAQKISARHGRKLLMNRGRAIAVTETTVATEQGKLASWRTLQDQGMISPGTFRVWTTAFDERTCPICMPLHRESVPLGEPFSIGIMGPPAHTLCRCSVNIRVVVPGMSRRRATLPRQPPQRTLDDKMEANRMHRNAQRSKFNEKYRPRGPR